MQESKIRVGNYEINYAQAGSGSNVLFIHDIDKRTRIESWNGLLSLGSSFRLIVPELIGYGKSSRPRDTPSFKEQANYLAEMLEKIGVNETYIVSHGYGAAVSLELILAWQGKVPAQVLIEPSYEKEQLRRMSAISVPTLIIFSEKDMLTQLKSGYIIRDMLRNTRLELIGDEVRLGSIDSHYIFRYIPEKITEMIKGFFISPSTKQSPELEDELKGVWMKKDLP